MSGRVVKSIRMHRRGLRTALLLSALLAALPLPLPGPLGGGHAPTAAARAPAQEEQGVVRPGGAELYDRPGGSVIAALEAVSFVTIYGRTSDALWVVVATADGQTGWVETARLITYNTESLPVMLVDGTPTGDAEGDAESSAPVVLPTPTPTPPATATPRPPTSTPTPPPPTATPTPTRTPRPTRTPTPTPEPPTPEPPTPTPVPTATAAEAPGGDTAPSAAPTPGLPGLGAPSLVAPNVEEVVAVVGVNGSSLRAAPGGAVVESLPVGAAILLVGRSADGGWFQTRLTNGQSGWVAAESVVAFNTAALPVTGTLPAVADTPPAAETAPAETTAPAAAPDAEPARGAGVLGAFGRLTGRAGAAPTMPAAPVETTAPAATGAEPPARPTPIEDGRPIATVLLTGGRLNVRAGPSIDALIVGKAAPRERFAVLGRTAAGDWVQVELPVEEGGQGWLSAAYVELNVPLDLLPIVEPGGLGGVAPPAAPSAAPPASESGLLLPTPTPTPVAGMPAPLPAVALTGTGPTGLSGNLAFQDGRNNLYVYNLDTGTVRFLTTGFDPAISPDGTLVAFNRGGGLDNGIYVIGIDGSNERKIWGEGEILRSPKWSPDAQRIVFSRLAGSYKCYNIEFIGCKSFRQLLAEFPFLAIPQVARRFMKGVERLEFPNWGISRVAADGSGDFRDIAALDSAVAPDWNEAGIVYQSAAGIEITEDTPEGDTRAVLREDWDHDPDWQPNGGLLLFTSKEGSHWEIWRMGPDGGGLVALTRPQTTLVDELPSNVAPAWSWDGQRIVYLSSRTADEEHGPWRLWVMDPDGGNKRPLDVGIVIDYSFAAEQVVSWGPPLP